MKRVTNREKERFCTIAASLLAPPDGAMMDDLDEDDLRVLIEGQVRREGGGRTLPRLWTGEGSREDFLATLQREYGRLFDPWEGEKISLVESTYKPWTTDPGCGMVFAASKGLLMGDSALHMQAIYRELSLEVPEALGSTPDHLVLELEFLGLLYRSGTAEQAERFIRDHLDWIPELKAAVEKADPHPFYRDAVGIIDLFLQQEVNQEGYDHGEKKVH